MGKTVYFRTEDLREGMTLGEDIFKEHTLILNKNSKLSKKDIQKLEIFNIKKIKIIISTEDKKKYGKKLFKETLSKTKEIFEEVIHNETVDIGKVEDIIEKIIDEVLNEDSFFDILGELKSEDEYTYMHSVETSVYSVVTGKKLNLSDKELKKLGVGSLLHDIGKTRVPRNVLQKNGKLTDKEFEEIKKHPLYGIEILIKSGIIDRDIIDIVSQHHEKINGSGYPNGIQGDKINKLSKIVAVSDIYDALTTDRVYRQKLKSYEVIEYLYCLVNDDLDIDIVSNFAKIIKIYPNGTRVMLNNGEIGEVVEQNVDIPLRPIIKLDSNQKIINLYNERTLLIEQILAK